MACPFFRDGRLTSCLAVEGVLIPSHHERERYCRTEGEDRCPTLRLYRLRRRPIPQADYYALWIAPVRRLCTPAAETVCMNGTSDNHLTAG